MARIHARRKGKSGSTHPIRKKHPDWSSLNPREIEARILELSKSGKTTSEIGMILRDQYAVPDIALATNKSITNILEKNNIKFDIPEDLRNLIKTALNFIPRSGRRSQVKAQTKHSKSAATTAKSSASMEHSGSTP